MLRDEIIATVDNALRTVFAAAHTVRVLPGRDLPEGTLTQAEARRAAALMRVNHVGEVCAQALYQGQALTARNPEAKQTLAQAAQEEVEHLAWCEARMTALGGRKSLLNPLWYAGSLVMGVTAGLLGDRWNLGFLAETERQVGAHLESHLGQLPAEDVKSRVVVEQMKDDEARHAEMAVEFGAVNLPAPVQGMMRVMSKIMTSTAYWI
uniref:Putative ubiquinone biosynthesis protein n=1 Tax=mine drainage metagenome TaxID=410659 RepID=E6QWZ7_9ZZZZ